MMRCDTLTRYHHQTFEKSPILSYYPSHRNDARFNARHSFVLLPRRRRRKDQSEALALRPSHHILFCSNAGLSMVDRESPGTCRNTTCSGFNYHDLVNRSKLSIAWFTLHAIVPRFWGDKNTTLKLGSCNPCRAAAFAVMSQ
jgi:hypothetical protein